MIKTIFVPITYKRSHEDLFFLEAKGKLQAFEEKATAQRTRAEAELDEALQVGFSVLHAGTVEDSSGTFFVYMLHSELVPIT